MEIITKFDRRKRHTLDEIDEYSSRQISMLFSPKKEVRNEAISELGRIIHPHRFRDLKRVVDGQINSIGIEKIEEMHKILLSKRIGQHEIMSELNGNAGSPLGKALLAMEDQCFMVMADLRKEVYGGVILKIIKRNGNRNGGVVPIPKIKNNLYRELSPQFTEVDKRLSGPNNMWQIFVLITLDDLKVRKLVYATRMSDINEEVHEHGYRITPDGENELKSAVRKR